MASRAVSAAQVIDDVFWRDVGQLQHFVHHHLRRGHEDHIRLFLGGLLGRGASGQTGPNMGANEGGVVSLHAGFNGSIGNPAATPMNILGGMTASGATIDTTLGDFTRNQGDVLIARITVVPEPTCVVLAIIGVVGLCVPMRRRKRRSAG